MKDLRGNLLPDQVAQVFEEVQPVAILPKRDYEGVLDTMAADEGKGKYKIVKTDEGNILTYVVSHNKVGVYGGKLPNDKIQHITDYCEGNTGAILDRQGVSVTMMDNYIQTPNVNSERKK